MGISIKWHHRCVIANPEKGLCAASVLPYAAYHWATFIAAEHVVF
jgi:hypothetical protein